MHSKQSDNSPNNIVEVEIHSESPKKSLNVQGGDISSVTSEGFWKLPNSHQQNFTHKLKLISEPDVSVNNRFDTLLLINNSDDEVASSQTLNEKSTDEEIQFPNVKEKKKRSLKRSPPKLNVNHEIAVLNQFPSNQSSIS